MSRIEAQADAIRADRETWPPTPPRRSPHMERIRPVHHFLAALVVLAVAGIAQAAVLQRSSTSFTVTVNGARQSAIMVSWPVSTGVHYDAYLNSARVATGLSGP